MKRHWHKKKAMKPQVHEQASLLSFVYRCLLVTAFFLVLVILGGTLFSFFRGSAGGRNIRSMSIHNTDNIPVLTASDAEHIFTGIGQMRIPTADSEPGTVIVNISFIYDPLDKAFSEELALRVKDFRDIITSYVGSFSSGGLHQLGEEKIKSELLQRFNAILRLGQIDYLLFNDFMVIG